MPFQSEKQRRFLHANHPEIAKRWERDYANGGISNHFRRRFFTGALADTQGPAGGQAMSPGTSTTGGTRHGGGGGNGGTGGNGHHPPSGPTAEEIAAQKAADEARLQAQEDARRNQIYEDMRSRRKIKKEKVDRVNTTLENLDAGLKLKKFSGSLNPLDLLKMDPLIFGTGFLYNTFKNKKKDKIKTSALDVDENIKVAKLSVKQIKEYKALDLKKKMNESGVGPPLTNEEKKELERLEKEKESKLTTDTGTAFVANGGILDIDASEEIISDDGNDIELTAYNAAFDDPNDLSTGVKSLFQAKEGGRTNYIYGGVSHPGGRRGFPGGSGRPGDRGMPVGGSGANYGGPPGGGDPQMTYTAPRSPHYKEEEETKQFAIQEDIRRREEEKGGEEYYGPTLTNKKINILEDKTREYILRNLKALDPNKYYEGMPGWKKAYEMYKSMPTLNLIGVLTAMYKEHKLTSEGRVILEEWGEYVGGPPGTNPQAYDDLWLALEKRKAKYRYDDHDPKHDPLTIELLEEKKEEIEDWDPTDWYSSLRDRIKAGQAKRAMLVEKGIIQDNPVVDESVTDITMQANRGGLANLFRVKNQ